MAEDGDDSQSHAREVAERVAREDFAWIPVVSQQAETGAKVGEEEVERELVVVAEISTQRHKVEDDEAGGDDDTLTNLEAVDASKYIDGVCAEHCQHAHVDIVKEAKVDRRAQNCPKYCRHHDLCPIGGDIVNHEQRQRSHGR